MISLTATNHILEINTSADSDIDVLVSFVDHTSTGGTLGDQQTLITTATNTTILSAPASSTQRQVKMVSIYNTSTSTTNTIIVKKDIGGTEYEIFRGILLPFERIEYNDGQGWESFANSGVKKASLNQGTSPTSSSLQTVVLTSDVVNNNATANTLQDVTGLSFPVTNGKTYYFKFFISYDAAAQGGGSRWTVGGVTTTRISYISQHSLSTTTQTTNYANAVDLPAAANGTSYSTTGNSAVVEGIVVASANGSLQLKFASEIASSAITAKAGSVCYYQELA